MESPFFRDNFSLKTILKTVSIVTEQRCTPEEIIYLEGDNDDSSIYFIEKGSVLFFHSTSVNNRETLSLNSLKQGAYFGKTTITLILKKKQQKKITIFIDYFSYLSNNDLGEMEFLTGQ